MEIGRKNLALLVLCCTRLEFLILVNDGALLCLFGFFFCHSYILNRGEMSLWCYNGIFIIWALFQAPEIN